MKRCMQPLLKKLLLRAPAMAFVLSAVCIDLTGSQANDLSREQYDYILNCQGCHRADGSETPGSVPPIRNHVARFLALPGGRDFIVRVPGVASAPLSDEAIASLMNWLLATFDPQHVPENFSPYTASEVRALRARPLTGQVAETRAALIKSLPLD